MEQCRTCLGCGETKPIEDFAIKRKSRAARCKPCLAAWAAEYRARASDRINANARDAYAADRTKKVASKDAYRARHRDRINAERRSWFADRYPVDPAPWRAARSRRKARGKHKMTANDRVISVEYRRAITGDPCFYCGSQPDERHVEHYYPLAKGGTDHWFNLVMSCGDCNRRKHLRCGTWFRLREFVTT